MFLCAQALFASQLLPFIGNVSGITFILHDIEFIAGLRSSVKTKDNYRFCRTGNVNTLITFVEHCFYVPVIWSCQKYVAYPQ